MGKILMVFALGFAMSFAGGATPVSSSARCLTENTTVSKTDSSSSMESGKSKKAHHKKHKHGSGSKRSK
jgi:hypothetical protein